VQPSLTLSIGLPVAIAIIMLGLGLSLRLEDFVRVLSRPRPVIIALTCQVIVLPILCLTLVFLSAMPPAISVGMMMLAASPAGTSAAIYTHLARGDVALSITITAVSSVLVMLTLPAIVYLGTTVFYGDGRTVGLEFHHLLQVFLISIVPAMVGAVIHRRYPVLARSLDRPVKILATVFLAAVVVFALVGQWGLVARWGLSVGVVALVYSLISFSVGYGIPRALKLEDRQAVAVAMSTGLHNGALVIAMAMSPSMLNNPELAIPPAAYGLIAYIVGGVVVWLLNRRR
jgi:BASS family bile acid:Na+ symporter